MNVNKTKVLFLTLHRPDRSPSQRFRFEQYIDFLNENSFDCDHFYLLNQQDDKIYYAKNKELRKLWIVLKSIFALIRKYFNTEKGIIIFVQRECFMLGSSFFERLFKKKGKIIFDFDDSIWIPTVSDANKRLAWLKRAGKTSEIISISNMVFAGNQYLANYAKQFNNNVYVVPTTIDTDKFRPNKKEQRDKVCIGWSGSFSTIEHLETCLDILLVIKQKYPDKVYFKIIGDGNYFNEKLDVKGLPWKKENEIEELKEIDIGIMPLPDNEWTRGKCAFKGILYMSLGLPAVMSPVGVNSEVILDGENGFLCNTPEEWIEKLSLLIENPQLRHSLGAKGRETIESRYSVNATKEVYLKLFRQLIEL